MPLADDASQGELYVVTNHPLINLKFRFLYKDDLKNKLMQNQCKVLETGHLIQFGRHIGDQKAYY